MTKITKDVELLPFRVPNYVIQKMPVRPRQEGFHEAPKYHLSELDYAVLVQLCDEFREGVFAKAAQGEIAHEGQTQND